MYPQLPENLSELTAGDLRKLAGEFRTARRKVAEEKIATMTAEEHDEWTQAGVIIARLNSLADDKDAEEAEIAAAEAATRAAEEAAANDAGDDTDGAGDGEQTAADETDDETDDDETDGEDGTDGASLHVPTGLSLPGEQKIVVPTATWQSTGLAGPAKDESFASTRDVGAAVADIMSVSAAGDNSRRTIATMKGAFSDQQRVTGEDLFVDLAKITDPDEIEAAFCPPKTPLYGLSCANVTRRPVFNGLPVFTPDANRGGFRVPESPSLTDITGGYGQWTSTDDANLSAIKEACQTISCVNWNDFEWYAVYRCLTVKNMMSMTFPELVDAYLNRLQAAWARYAEILLLEAMGNASTSLDGFAQAYGANVSLQRNLLTYLGKYAEIERWDTPMMDAWMPRWLLWALRMDIASRRRDGGGQPATVDQVEAGFRDIGVEPHWYMDRPSWATPISPLAVNGDLTHFPSQVEILIHRRGKFAVMDKGELNLGLGGNPIRIEDDVRRNQHTFFFESYEGLINTDSCPAHLITVPGLCYSGHQIADAQIECEGYNLVGVGSGA